MYLRFAVKNQLANCRGEKIAFHFPVTYVLFNNSIRVNVSEEREISHVIQSHRRSLQCFGYFGLSADLLPKKFARRQAPQSVMFILWMNINERS